MSIDADRLKEEFQTWKRLPNILGRYDEVSQPIEEQYKGYTTGYPKFDNTVKKALIDGHVELSDIAEIVVRTYAQVNQLIEQYNFFKNEKNQFLLFRLLPKHAYQTNLELERYQNDPKMLNEEFRPVMHYFNSIDEAHEYEDELMPEIPRHYFI